MGGGGPADVDGDGAVSGQELYHRLSYVYSNLFQDTPRLARGLSADQVARLTAIKARAPRPRVCPCLRALV